MKTKDDHVAAEKIITFADPLDMVACLSAERVRLIQTVRRKRLSISSLAKELGRDRSAVSRDVNRLAEFGLLVLRQQNNPGHGFVVVAEVVADKLVLRADI
jgi:predicted transcriptional regulator